MSYLLRPEATLKRPARFRETGDEGTSYPLRPKPRNQDAATGSQSNSLVNASSANPNPPGSSSFTTDALRFSQNSPPSLDMSTAPRVALAGASNPSNTPETRKMANVKYVKKRPRDQEQPVAPPVRDRAGRTRPSQRATAPDTESEPTFSSSKPAAFPSLSANAPPSSSLPAVMTFSGHGMVELMDAMESNDDGRVGSIKRHFDHEYEAGTSPWYADLRGRWDPNTQDSPVTFESLWGSIRQTIIEEIKDDFPKGTYFSSFYPVCHILKITKAKLDRIMAENAEVWENDDMIPRYFQEYRKRYPKAIIDPDEPPPTEVVRAIRFLKQQSLPGSLLGEWQKLPAVEAFMEPSVEEIGESMETVESGYHHHETTRERPNVISLDQTLQLIARIEQDKAKQAEKKQKNASKRSQERCKRCKEKGHTALETDESGVCKCPERLREVTEHRAEIEALRAQASAELAAMTQPPSPMDAAPLLAAWQAMRMRMNENGNPVLTHSAGPPGDDGPRYINPAQIENRVDPMWGQGHSSDPMESLARIRASNAVDDPAGPMLGSSSQYATLHSQLNQQPSHTSTTLPVWPNTPHLRPQPQQTVPPHVPKKRGPYKKKDKAPGPNSTSPPANRVIGRGGMVSLVPLNQASNMAEAQKKNEEAEAQVETGLATPPLSQQQQQEQPSGEKHKSEGMSSMQSESRENANEHGTSAVLPPYPHQNPPPQDQGHVPPLEKNTYSQGKQTPVQVQSEEPEAMELHVAP